MKPTITIEAATDGKITISVNDVKGESCKDLTENIERALGITTNQTETPDFYERPNVNNQHISY